MDPSKIASSEVLDRNINVALVVNAGVVGTFGVCDESECLVTLERDADEGWTPIENGDGDLLGIALPRAVCAAVKSKALKGVAISDACPTKSPTDPLCEEEPVCLKTGGPCP